jgi:hypothetical protein
MLEKVHRNQVIVNDYVCGFLMESYNSIDEGCGVKNDVDWGDILDYFGVGKVSV